MSALATRFEVIDIDTHVIEPYDLWTSRVSTQFGSRVPHVRREADGKDWWFFDERKSIPAASSAQAGWHQFSPNHPPTLSDACPETWNAQKRLIAMDESGIYAQVLFPNLVGVFAAEAIASMRDPELMLDVVRAYNDFLHDWASANPRRLLPQTTLPVWNVDLAVTEMYRCAKLGNRGIVITDSPQHFGQPKLTSRHWDRLWAAAQDMGMVVNFHIGAGDNKSVFDLIDEESVGKLPALASQTVLLFLNNARALVQLTAAICHRFPRINFVSVESGVGWVPFALHALDWQWKNTNLRAEYPGYLLPSEYFRRQIYASFWFEQPSTLLPAIEVLGEDNILYETDFPHPTSMSPGPGSIAQSPRDYIDDVFKNVPETATRKILHDNAARIYHIE